MIKATIKTRNIEQNWNNVTGKTMTFDSKEQMIERMEIVSHIAGCDTAAYINGELTELVTF